MPSITHTHAYHTHTHTYTHQYICTHIHLHEQTQKHTHIPVTKKGMTLITEQKVMKRGLYKNIKIDNPNIVWHEKSFCKY